MRGFGVMCCLLMCVQAGWSQSYPGWFLEQGALRCRVTAVGYANRGFYMDSSASQAVRNARQNLARQVKAIVSGGESFWATESGTAWMGGDLSIAYDSSALRGSTGDMSNATVFDGEEIIFSLVTDGSCSVPDSMKTPRVMAVKEPAWVRSLPKDGLRIYSIGVAPEYFYETSSWSAAERMALLGLAKGAGDSVAAVQKGAAGSGQQVLDEQVSVTLREYGVLARWFDTRNRVFYVLMAVDKKNIDRRASDNRRGGP